jgi:hypothetical protein
MLLAASLAGCEREEPIAFYRAPKEQQPTAPAVIRLASWTTPSGWVRDEQPRPMRELTFRVASGDRQAEVIVAKLAAGSFGDLAANINRWRGQVGLEPIADTTVHAPEEIAIGGSDGVLFDFTGPDPDRRRLLVVMAPVQDDVWFLKMIGPADLVAQQRPAFEMFLKSVRFVGHMAQ